MLFTTYRENVAHTNKGITSHISHNDIYHEDWEVPVLESIQSKMESLFTCFCEKKNLEILRQVDLELPHVPEITLLRIYPENTDKINAKFWIQNLTCIPMFCAELSTIVRFESSNMEKTQMSNMNR